MSFEKHLCPWWLSYSDGISKFSAMMAYIINVFVGKSSYLFRSESRCYAYLGLSWFQQLPRPQPARASPMAIPRTSPMAMPSSFIP